MLQVKNWVRELRRMLGQDVCLCIVGNKTDLEKDRHVPVDEAEAYVVAYWIFGGEGNSLNFRFLHRKCLKL